MVNWRAEWFGSACGCYLTWGSQIQPFKKTVKLLLAALYEHFPDVFLSISICISNKACSYIVPLPIMLNLVMPQNSLYHTHYYFECYHPNLPFCNFKLASNVGRTSPCKLLFVLTKLVIICMSGCFLIVANSSALNPDNSIKFLLLVGLIPRPRPAFCHLCRESLQMRLTVSYSWSVYQKQEPVYISKVFSQRASYMQFWAARSRCTMFLLARYSIPLPIWMHMSARRLSATVAFDEGRGKQTTVKLKILHVALGVSK